MPPPFRDRSDAGRQLAERLGRLGLDRPVVLALPRGGVPVAAEVAASLGAPLEVFVVRKLGLPGHEELGVGAIAEGSDAPVVSPRARAMGVDDGLMRDLAERERAELTRRVNRYRRDRSLPPLAGREVVLVDDGLATGVTAEAALVALRAHRPSRLVLAVPVCAPETAARLASAADDVVCAELPAVFLAVGRFYEDFSQTTDEEVVELLDRAHAGAGPPS